MLGRIAVGFSTILPVSLATMGPARAGTTTAFEQLGSDINGGTGWDEFGYAVATSQDGSRVAIGSWGYENYSTIGRVDVYEWDGTTWSQLGTGTMGEATSDGFGFSVALSNDGTRLAVGAYLNDGGGSNSGHVRVYDWNGTAWAQTGADIDGASTGDYSGSSLALSSNGSRLAIGSPKHDADRGHVRVFDWTGTAWVQTGLDIDGEAINDRLGTSVTISADGNRLAIGAPGNDGTGEDSGHVRIYNWTGTAWVQTGTDIDGDYTGDQFGSSVAISEDGSWLAIGAPLNDGNGSNSGHVRIYVWNGVAWEQWDGDIDGRAVGVYSGWAVALARDASRLVVGAPYSSPVGHVRVFGLPVDDTPTPPDPPGDDLDPIDYLPDWSLRMPTVQELPDTGGTSPFLLVIGAVLILAGFTLSTNRRMKI